jgi:hypothetical protein
MNHPRRMKDEQTGNDLRGCGSLVATAYYPGNRLEKLKEPTKAFVTAAV